ncbi:MAG: peptide chain release factor N(5)-glutamine methyltransferase [Anaerolineaceae bacterium]|nr:peptide chain release factor N(5)-glutamine methyltransferase [Anaerolineaceae bacterium]
MNLKQIRAEIQSSLAENSIETPGNISLLLLSHLLNKPKSWVLAHPEFEIAIGTHYALQTALDRLLQGVPLPHILGEWEFYGRPFIVSPDVLIPRPETELLIDRALALASGIDTPRIVDVGTGSGAIAVTLAAELPQANVIATDISRPALLIARQNAQKHLTRPLPLVQADLLQPLSGTFDLICANLPYIPSRSLQDLPVAQWEPVLALDGGPSGLDLIESLLHQARSRLAPSGHILLEIESSLGAETLSLAQAVFPNGDVHLHQDLAGKDRLVEIKSP